MKKNNTLTQRNIFEIAIYYVVIITRISINHHKLFFIFSKTTGTYFLKNKHCVSRFAEQKCVIFLANNM